MKVNKSPFTDYIGTSTDSDMYIDSFLGGGVGGGGGRWMFGMRLLKYCQVIGSDVTTMERPRPTCYAETRSIHGHRHAHKAQPLLQVQESSFALRIICRCPTALRASCLG